LEVSFQFPKTNDFGVRNKVKRIRVILADDHTLVRAGIRALLERFDEIEVTGEAGNGYEALALIRQQVPDLVLLDMVMPGINGLEVLKRIKQEFPTIQVIILSVHETEEYAIRAFQAGAAGYLPKKAATGELVEAIKKVMSGEEYISPEVSGRTGHGMANGLAAEGNATRELTPRQRDVLKMIAEGFSTKQIAKIMNISAKTVETHRALLMDRLNIHDVAGLVRYAIKIGLIEIEVGRQSYTAKKGSQQEQ
jgi:DNA-binding NarL/FixJ family response regulator